MGIEKVRRWQWVAISLLAGFLVAEVRRAIPRPLSDYGADLSDQKTFESAIVRDYKGKRLFHDLVVYPVEVDEGGRKSLKHFVTGQYFSGKPRKEGGSWRAEWKPYCFVAPIPFKPMTRGEAEDPARRVLKSFAPPQKPRAGPARPVTQPSTASAGAPASAAVAAASEGQTVVDYLARMRREHGVSFTYAWWQHPQWQRVTWMAGSFVLIGLVWPTGINLMKYGTLRRPPEAELPSLWEAVRSLGRRAAKAPKPGPAVARAGTAEVEAYDAALEASLADSSTDRARVVAEAATAAGSSDRSVAKPLAADAELVGVEGPHAEHHYEAKQDDFYPVEKHVHHDPTPKARKG